MDGLTMSAVVRRAAELHPYRTAILYEDRRWTYREYDERVNRAANLLRGLDVGFGEHVAILGRNSIEYLELCHASGRIGAVFGTINWRLAPKEISFIVTDGDAKVLFVEAMFQDAVAAVQGELAGVTLVVYDGPVTLPGAASYEDLFAAAATDDPQIEVNSDDEALIMYTSGTTGLPKGAVLTHGNICWDMVAYLSYAPPRNGDVALLSMPTNHVSGLHMVVNGFFAKGLPVVVARQFDAAEVCRLIAEHRVTQACILVTPLQMLLEYADLHTHDLSSLRSVLTAAAKYNREFPATVMHKLELEHLWFAYGLTEASPMVSVTEFVGEMADRENTLGRPMWYLDVRIADENDQPVAPGEVGEVLVKGPNVFRGYYNRDDVNKEVLRGGWLHTGDLARADSDGYLYFVDRKKDMIKSGGENVFSLEVEMALLAANPELAEVAVLGIPDDRWGEAVTAFVTFRDGRTCDAAELVQRTRHHLAGYKLPKSVHVREELPKNVSGKVLKRVLRADLLGDG